MSCRIITIIASILILSGCSAKTKEKLGMTTTGPNEYAVKTNKPLDVPPHYELPAPAAEPAKKVKKK